MCIHLIQYVLIFLCEVLCLRAFVVKKKYTTRKVVLMPPKHKESQNQNYIYNKIIFTNYILIPLIIEINKHTLTFMGNISLINRIFAIWQNR